MSKLSILLVCLHVNLPPGQRKFKMTAIDTHCIIKRNICFLEKRDTIYNRTTVHLKV